MKTLTIISLLFFAMIFTNCDETKKVIDLAGTVQLSGNYIVTEIGMSAVDPNSMTFSLAALDKTINGNTGCNSFFGNYTLDMYALGFGDFAVTERYCDEPVMIAERAYLKALGESGSYTLQNNILTLYSKLDRSVLLKAQKETNQGN
jgi:heat shock protein HslJ